MSTDQSVTQQLIETLENGRDGYEKGAKKLRDAGQSQLADAFEHYADQRAGFAADLTSIASAYGDGVEESGTMAGVIHRGWMTLKDAASGSSPSGVLDVATEGEKHAVEEFEKALEADVSPDLRSVIQRQLVEVRAALAAVSAMRIAG